MPQGSRALGRRLLEESARLFGAIIGVRTHQRAVALTFDDGPHPADTPAMLEVLARHGARGTFFFLGRHAARYPEIVARTAAEGHAIGSHGWDHSSFALLNGRHRRAQLRWTAEALAPHGLPLFRPPYGELGAAGRLDVFRSGHQLLCWDSLAEDWRNDDAAVLADRALRRLRPGSIVLFHDTLASAVSESNQDRAATREAVSLLIAKLGGTKFVTVPELLAMGPPVRWHWYRRAHLDWHRRLL